MCQYCWGYINKLGKNPLPGPEILLGRDQEQTEWMNEWMNE